MKIEKINNNQIKCFLNKGDLLSREIKVSELAYGTDKAQELFKDMMAQANDEFGFEVDNVPLMIEAVPLSTDSIMLIITKVDNPEDLENKFSTLSDTETRSFRKKLTNSYDTPALPASTTDNTRTSSFFLYSFDSFDAVQTIAEKLRFFAIDNSSLYKNEEGRYHLILISEQLDRNECKVVRGILSEYGDQIIAKKNMISYYDEHYERIIRDKAIKVLISL